MFEILKTDALREQLRLTRERFLRELSRATEETALEVIPAYPHESPGLQVADYCLWALQRLFEKEEDRYVQMLWPKVALIHDVDDTCQNRYGCYYNKRKPLTLADIKNRQV